MQYSNVPLPIDGFWRHALPGETLPVVDPATGDAIGHHLAVRLEADMLSIDHHGLTLPKTPIGGVEGLKANLPTKFVAPAAA